MVLLSRAWSFFPFLGSLVAFHSQPKIKKNWFHFIQGGFFISLWTSEILIESARRRDRNKKNADRLRATCWRVINTRSSDSEKNPHSSRKRKFFSLISPAAPEKEEFNCSFYYYYFVCELETHITIARLQKKSVAFKSNLPGNAPPNVLCRFFFPRWIYCVLPLKVMLGTVYARSTEWRHHILNCSRTIDIFGKVLY